MDAKAAIRLLALEQGFDAVAFTTARLPQGTAEGLRGFLANGHHGDMGWMAANVERRSDPQTLWPETRTIIILGQNYAPAYDPFEKLRHKDCGAVSCYAQNEDYHDVVKKKLRELARSIAVKFACEVKLFVDTAPVMEKPLAQQAGLGWQGKHTCIVSRQFGSWLFLGEIFTTLALPSDMPEEDHCGSCNRCIAICPTQAFTAERQLDARRCISYLTIEHQGHIAREFRAAIGNRIYGCDDCLAVCPWNKFAQDSHEAAYHPRAALEAPLLRELAVLDDAGFRNLFRKSPIKRIGRNRFIRNVLIALGNSANPNHIPTVEALLTDASPLVRAMAVWALAQLEKRPGFLRWKQHLFAQENDAQVLNEWREEIPPHSSPCITGQKSPQYA